MYATLQREVEREARACGLDFYETTFTRCDAEELRGLAARGGFAHRYPHGRWRREALRRAQRDRRLPEVVHELVVNGDPARAWLLADAPNPRRAIVHALAHVDFFKNNRHFAETPRDMGDRMEAHAERVRGYGRDEGEGVVERWIDACIPIEGLRIEGLDDQLGELPAWKRDVLRILTDEAAYFAPQARTRLVNEGWATYWHERLTGDPPMRGADPYVFGPALLREAEDRIFAIRAADDDVALVEALVTEGFARRVGAPLDRLKARLLPREAPRYALEEDASGLSLRSGDAAIAAAVARVLGRACRARH